MYHIIVVIGMFAAGFLLAKGFEPKEETAPLEWHSLENNPDDKPEKRGRYICAFSYEKHDGSRGFTYQVIPYEDGWNCLRRLNGEIYRGAEMTDVVAWAELEEYE